MTAVNPSRTSSPVRLGSLSLRIPSLRVYSLSVRVRAVLNPVRCVPPSGLKIALAKQRMFSVKSSVYCIEISISENSPLWENSLVM